MSLLSDRKFFSVFTFLFLSVFICSAQMDTYKFNAYGVKYFTLESQHFEISYPKGYAEIAREAGEIFEGLYNTYTKTYNVALPSKTKILVLDAELTNGFAFSNLNFIVIWPHDFDINLRGTHEWLKGVCAHEFAHIVSIWSGLKLPPAIPYVQAGFAMHPNEQSRADIFHAVSTDILPNWFVEGIAQYEDSRNGTDSWDTHRDMIVRTLTLSHKLLKWDHMSVFAGKGDDFEKTYNHGFSLIKYISEKYGYDKVVTMLRESSKAYHLSFNAVIKQVLGISAQQLYSDWRHDLETQYKKQLENIGKQVYGRKINKDGYDNYWPRFSPNQKKVYFISNGKNDYSFLFKSLYSYSLDDTVKEDKKIKREKGVGGFYSIHQPTGRITYTSMKSPKSTMPPELGGDRVYDAFIDTLPPDKPSYNPFKKKTERMVTKRFSAFASAFSPSGNKLALAHRVKDRFYLCIADTNGKNIRVVYPDSLSPGKVLEYIYTMDWSPDGRRIAVSFFDHYNRKIGIYDTLDREFTVLSNADHDDRDPRYGSSGKRLYFASDRTGIFNAYRYDFDSKKLQKLTNVSGGVFAPDISKDEKKLVFANYDKDGYGIYLIDTLKVLQESAGDSMWVAADSTPPKPSAVAFSEPRDYSRIPRQFLCMPTLIAEQLVTDQNNPYKGQTAIKLGAVVNLLDPLGFMNLGNEVGGYFLFEGSKLFHFFELSPEPRINARMNYDFGVFGTTHALPVTMSTDYMFRGISGTDQFYDEYLDQNVVLPYQVRLHYFDLIATQELAADMKLHLIGSYNAYNVLILGEDTYDVDFEYPLSKGFRGGVMWTFLAQDLDSRMNISPKGLYAKLQYGYHSENSLDKENQFNSDGSYNYQPYRYLQMSGNIKFGMQNPIFEKHDLYLDIRGSAIKAMDERSDSLPSFYFPAAIVPGYAFYDTVRTLVDVKNDVAETTHVLRDTLVITGKAVLNGSASYRFPLWPGSIDRSILFIYFDRLFGAVNVSGGAGFQHLSDVKNMKREDWLLSYGLEARLEAISFNSFPMAMKFRWDRGIDKKAPIGGNRYAFTLGFSFDDWELIDLPDYRFPVKLSR